MVMNSCLTTKHDWSITRPDGIPIPKKSLEEAVVKVDCSSKDNPVEGL